LVPEVIMSGSSQTWLVFSFCLASSAVATSIASAQKVEPGIGVGVGFPTGRLGAERHPGPIVNGYAVLGSPERTVRFQIGVEGAWFRGKTNPSALGSSAEGDLRIIGLLANLLIASGGERIRPYLTLGGGLQSLSIKNRRNPYGSIVGLRGGVGLEAPLGNNSVRVEVQAHAILSDFGTGQDFGLGTYVPFTLAFQF
jgi:hypothetical protein